MPNMQSKYLKEGEKTTKGRTCLPALVPLPTNIFSLLPRPLTKTTMANKILKNYSYNASAYLMFLWPSSGPLLSVIQLLLPISISSRKIFLYTYIFSTWQINVGSNYKGALNTLLSIPFSPSIVNCCEQLLEEYTLKMTQIALERLGFIRRLAQQLDLILQLVLTTRKTVTNEMKDVLDLWITATPREEMLIIQQFMTNSMYDPALIPSSTTQLSALSVVDVTISWINAQTINVKNADDEIWGITKSSAFCKNNGLNQGSRSPRDKRPELATISLTSFPMNPCPRLLVVSPREDEDDWQIFSPRPKTLYNFTPTLEGIIEPTFYSGEDSPQASGSNTPLPHLANSQPQFRPIEVEDTIQIIRGGNQTTSKTTPTTTTILTTSPRAIFWENPLGIEVDADIDSKNGNYVMTLSDSPGLSAIDQQWLDSLWNEEMMTLASLTHTP